MSKLGEIRKRGEQKKLKKVITRQIGKGYVNAVDRIISDVLKERGMTRGEYEKLDTSKKVPIILEVRKRRQKMGLSP